MNPASANFRPLVWWACVGVLLAPAALLAQGKKINPASKLYVSDVAGEAQINTGESIKDLTRQSVYTAQGAIIDTKMPASMEDRSKYYSTMVYSNGTGAFFDAGTRVEIRRFVQEPFVPTRSDNEVEPSISQTQAFVSRGTVGLCPSKMVAGSSMVYVTPHGSVNIGGRKVVIQADPAVTRISMLEGDCTVRAGDMDMGGHTVHSGEQAVIRPGMPGQPNIIDIRRIPPAEVSQLDDKVAMACMAKKTVYFDVRGRQQANAQNDAGSEVDAFNMASQAGRNAGGPFTSANGEIIAVPLLPTNLPVQFTVSPAAIITPTGKVITPPRPPAATGAGGSPGS